MKFILYINADNDAFRPLPFPELAHILVGVALMLARADANGTLPNGGWVGHFQTILDHNGNDVGRYALKEDGYELKL